MSNVKLKTYSVIGIYYIGYNGNEFTGYIPIPNEMAEKLKNKKLIYNNEVDGEDISEKMDVIMNLSASEAKSYIGSYISLDGFEDLQNHKLDSKSDMDLYSYIEDNNVCEHLLKEIDNSLIETNLQSLVDYVKNIKKLNIQSNNNIKNLFGEKFRNILLDRFNIASSETEIKIDYNLINSVYLEILNHNLKTISTPNFIENFDNVLYNNISFRINNKILDNVDSEIFNKYINILNKLCKITIKNKTKWSNDYIFDISLETDKTDIIDFCQYLTKDLFTKFKLDVDIKVKNDFTIIIK